jgi:hypothetical protein
MAQLAWRQCEVVVLHEQERRRGRGLVGDGSREAHVRGPIGQEVPRSKYRLDPKGMTQGPEALVRESIVVAAILRL